MNSDILTRSMMVNDLSVIRQVKQSVVSDIFAEFVVTSAFTMMINISGFTINIYSAEHFLDLHIMIINFELSL